MASAADQVVAAANSAELVDRADLAVLHGSLEVGAVLDDVFEAGGATGEGARTRPLAANGRSLYC